MSGKNSIKGVENFWQFLVPVFIVAGFFIFVGNAKAAGVIISQDTTWHNGQMFVATLK